jgi:hypothetical protein
MLCSFCVNCFGEDFMSTKNCLLFRFNVRFLYAYYRGFQLFCQYFQFFEVILLAIYVPLHDTYICPITFSKCRYLGKARMPIFCNCRYSRPDRDALITELLVQRDLVDDGPMCRHIPRHFPQEWNSKFWQ